MELENIIIEDEEKSESSKDIIREEELWTDRNYNYFRNMQEEIKNKSIEHDQASHKNKKRYIKTAIPAMMIPLILTNLTIFCDDYYLKYITPLGMTFVGIINGFQTILNFSKKKEIHNIYAGKYMDLFYEIDKVLIRKKKFREPFDVVLERINLKKHELDNGAPYL